MAFALSHCLSYTVFKENLKMVNVLKERPNIKEKINSINVLNQQECQEVRSVVHEFKDLWIKRNPYVPFYTLGTASYLDAAEDQQKYYQLAQQYNPILRDRLEWLYQKVAKSLTQLLNAPTNYSHSLAIPGFHVFLSSKIFEQPVSSVHTDLQYQLVDWESSDKINFDDALSFTLAICLPKFGGGLNVWDVDHQEINEIPKSELGELIKSRKKSFYPYQIGHLIIHSGHTLHQIAPAQNIQFDDERITLQGHSVFSQGAWQLYW